MNDPSDLTADPFDDDEYGGTWSGLTWEDWPVVAAVAAGLLAWAAAVAAFG